jgi:hypothetical protein
MAAKLNRLLIIRAIREIRGQLAALQAIRV